ncbi:MAG TPA: response regulator [Verrucomicrobiae bacterium]
MGHPLNILLAEDNADDIFFMRQAFKQTGVSSRLHSVCDGLEAKAYLLGESAFADRDAYPFPDILLLDLNMPRMNGFEVLEWLRDEPSCEGLFVYVLTASCREEDIRRVYSLHANCYVMKPNRLEELVDFVRVMHEWHRFACLARPRFQAKAVFYR